MKKKFKLKFLASDWYDDEVLESDDEQELDDELYWDVPDEAPGPDYAPEPETEWPAYKKFIKKARKMLEDQLIYDESLPALELYSGTTYFTVQLSNIDGKKEKVAIRTDNLYMIPLKTGGTWYELKEVDEEALMSNSESAGFDKSYASMAYAANVQLFSVGFGRTKFINSIFQLAAATNAEEMALPALVFVRMVCEGIRFKSIAKHFYSGKKHFPTILSNQTLQWGKLSLAMFEYEKTRNFSLPPQVVDKIGIENVDQAVKILGIVQNSPTDKSGGQTSEEIKVPVGKPKGRPVMELKGAATSKKGRSHFKGHLSISDTGKSGKQLHKRHYFNGRSIFYVSEPIEGSLSTINVSFTIDGELFWEELKWDQSMLMPYDRMRFHNIKRENNQMVVGYIVYENAVQAMLEVSFFSKDGSPFRLCGLIAVKNSDERNPRVIYRGNEKSVKTCESGEAIALLASVIWVPFQSFLIMETNQKDANSVICWRMVHKSVYFSPQYFDTSEETIYGENGSLKFKVTWQSNIEDSAATSDVMMEGKGKSALEDLQAH